MRYTEANRPEHTFDPSLGSHAIPRRNAAQGYSKHSVPPSNFAVSPLRAPQINRAKLISDRESHLGGGQ
jgi:hypothetical protein